MNSCGDYAVCHEIRQAIAANRPEDLQRIVSRVAQFSFKHPTDNGVEFADNMFECIIEAMTTSHFQRMTGADALLVLFEYDWSMLTVSQRATLLTTIEATYAHFNDSNSCFVLAELLGEYFCNRQAFECLVRLTSVQPDHARALTAHGFRQFAGTSADTRLKALCLARLKKLAEDKSPTVRQEAIEALRHIDSVPPIPNK